MNTQDTVTREKYDFFLDKLRRKHLLLGDRLLSDGPTELSDWWPDSTSVDHNREIPDKVVEQFSREFDLFLVESKELAQTDAPSRDQPPRSDDPLDGLRYFRGPENCEAWDRLVEWGSLHATAFDTWQQVLNPVFAAEEVLYRVTGPGMGSRVEFKAASTNEFIIGSLKQIHLLENEVGGLKTRLDESQKEVEQLKARVFTFKFLLGYGLLIAYVVLFHGPS